MLRVQCFVDGYNFKAVNRICVRLWIGFDGLRIGSNDGIL
jgi:hypothetical protein